MSIPETVSFDKDGETESKGRGLVRKFFPTLVIIFVAVLAFGVGRLTGSRAGEPVKIEYDPSLLPAAAAIAPAPQLSQKPVSNSTVYASNKGTKYYYASCGGLSKVSPANKISFPSSRAAEAAGYSLASGCAKP